MKTKSIVIFFVILLAVVLIVSIRNTPPGYKKQLNELRKELKAIELQRDSVYNQIKITQDGLKIANENLKLAELASEKAKKQTKYYKDKYEKVRFVDFPNDSVRSSELSKLYPSYQNPR